MTARRAVLLVVLAASGCVGPRVVLPHETPLQSVIGDLDLKTSGDDPAETVRVANALVAAAPPLRRWGTLRAPVEVSVLPSHAALENAVRRRGYDWLRAWGRYDEILLQSPKTWPGQPVSDSDLAELLTHELTHCLMFQRAAGPEDWTRRKIPIWFREGMASWTAKQGYRRPSLDDLADILWHRPPLEVFTDGEALSKTQERFVYGIAHHAFTFLVKRYGDEAIERILDRMHEGLTFKDAFARVIGLDEDTFAAEFERYVRWGGYRRLPVYPPGSSPSRGVPHGAVQ